MWRVCGTASSHCATGGPRVIQPTCNASRPPSVRLDTRLRRGLLALCPRPTVRRKPHVPCVRNRIQPLRHGRPACDPTYLQSLPAPLGAIGHSLAPGPIGLMSPAHREAQAACGSCVEAHPRSTRPLRHGGPARDPTYLQSLPAPLGAIGHSLAPGPIGLMSPAHREAHRARACDHAQRLGVPKRSGVAPTQF